MQPLRKRQMQRNARGMQYTAGQAAEATGKNIATITRAIKSGKISANKDASGAWRIDASELHRVYPLSTQNRHKGEMQRDARPPQEQSSSKKVALQEELALLRERVVAQTELLLEQSEQISELTKHRDRCRQQATSPLPAQRPKGLFRSLSG